MCAGRIARLDTAVQRAAYTGDTGAGMKAKRRTSTEENQKYWNAVDKIVKSAEGRERRIQVGEPWTDSRRDISASLVADLPRK